MLSLETLELDVKGLQAAVILSSEQRTKFAVR